MHFLQVSMGRVVVTIIMLGLGLTVACVTTLPQSQDTQPGDMSAAEHRKKAEQHEGAARATEMYGAGRVAPIGSASNEWGAVGRNRVQQNVGMSQAQQAFEHRLHAQQHREAALLLEVFEDAECKMLAAPLRAGCPLLDQVVTVEQIPQGVRIHLREGTDTAQMLQRMRCHHAFGRAQGFKRMGTCPLYLDRIEITRTLEGDIEVTSLQTGLVEEIRKRIRIHVQPPSDLADPPRAADIIP